VAAVQQIQPQTDELANLY